MSNLFTSKVYTSKKYDHEKDHQGQIRQINSDLAVVIDSMRLMMQ